MLAFLGMGAVVGGDSDYGAVVFHDDCREGDWEAQFLAEGDEVVENVATAVVIECATGAGEGYGVSGVSSAVGISEVGGVHLAVQEFGLSQSDGSVVWVVCKLEAEETSGIHVECDLVVFADTGNQSLQVVRVVGEDEGIVDVDEDVSRFRRTDAIEEAVVERGHDVPFGAER